MRRVTAGLMILEFAALTVSCALLPRYPSASPRNEVWSDEKLAESMAPWFLAQGFADHLAIEVDWVVGCKPGPHTIEGLRKIAAKYAPDGQTVRIDLDDEIPRAEWDALLTPVTKGTTGTGKASRTDPVAVLVDAHADFAREPLDPEARTTHLYVLCVPGTDRWFFGYGSWWHLGDGIPGASVNGIVVFHDAHARFAKLWWSTDRLEATTIVHEYGHMLGLVSNPTHARREPHGGHCTSLKCLMAQPSVRVYLRNAFPAIFGRFPTDYCRRCQDDIRRAQAAWRARMARDPDSRASLVAKLQAWNHSLSLRRAFERGEYERVIDEAARARRLYPDQKIFDIDFGAMIALQRFDEAIARLKASDPKDRVSLSWTLGRALVLGGRYEDAIALFNRDALRKEDEYDFEQSSFVLLDAFDRAGELDEAIALIDEMLARGPLRLWSPPGPLPYRADLLRRAGRLAEALGAARKGLASKKTRSYWYATGVDIYETAGRHDEARELLKAWLAAEEKPSGRRARSGRSTTWQRSWTIAAIQARLGDRVSALAMMKKAGPPPDTLQIDQVLQAEIPVFARLEDWDRAAEALHAREKDSGYDVCGNREIAPMRHDPRYADIFRTCANSPSAK